MGPTLATRAGWLLLMTAAALTGSAATQGVKEFRVCADPDNLPFSNDKQEGFENRIAALFARERGESLTYTWWPQRRGFLRNTLRAGECDVLMSAPKGYDPVYTTRPYYRSTYYFVSRQDRNLQVRSLDDPALRRLKIGVHLIGEDYTNTPPAHALGARGVVGLVGFSTFYSATTRPGDIIDAVAQGDIDLAIVWGPIPGYFAKRQPVPLTLVPLPDSVDQTGLPFAYDIALGVRRSDRALGAQLDSLLERKHADIMQILREYGVPIIGASPSPRHDQPPRPQAAARDSLLATETEYQGWKWFHVYCYRCHGTEAIGGQLAPDLRHSVSSEGRVTHDVFMVMVRDGRPEKGMPAWKVLLNDNQIEDLWAYVKARSDGRLAPGRPHRAPSQ